MHNSKMAQDARARETGSTSEAERTEAARATPMMSQYLELKAANPGLLLFYRLGDFYELFFEDAETASRALGLAITKRGRHQGEDVPMCGVPVRAADEYLQRLIRLGHRVAICEQTENPDEARGRGAKSVIRREIVRLVTPGTLTEESLLEPARPNYLLALAPDRLTGNFALAWADISTGEFFTCLVPSGQILSELTRVDPCELILPETVLADQDLARALKHLPASLTPLPSSRFDSINGELRLKSYFSVSALQGYGAFARAEIAAAGALLDYVVLTQAGKLPSLAPPRRSLARETLAIDAATRGNLELIKTLSGESRGGLLAAIDRTVTGAGARLLAQRLSGPLTDVDAINARLDAVAFFVNDGTLRHSVRAMLARLPDMSRSLGRLSLDRGGPRDASNIAKGLSVAHEVAALFEQKPGFIGPPPEISSAAASLSHSSLSELRDEIAEALAEVLPLLARDGNFVRPGYRAELDEERRLKEDSRRVIAELQAAYVEKTGIKSLKIRQNNFLGYFLELNQQNGEALLKGRCRDEFIHRQTTVGAMRFTTVALADLQSRITSAADKALEIELAVFSILVRRVREAEHAIAEAARALAVIDVSAALADLAVSDSFARPAVDRSSDFFIKSGRHPVVEQALKEVSGENFIANDCRLSAAAGDGHRILLLTGPNMAGKSTFLRQNALMVVLAQMGSFVPATEARLGVVDRLYSRVGAADDLARGRSTFMVEMVETAAILNQATSRSFVILDEIGRGTATFDGLSIAWATLEHLHEAVGCRALFATHFHELTALASKLKQLGNITMKVNEWQGDIVFLHEVAAGAADRSYGIHVGKRAGLPPSVVARAEEVLDLLERSQLSATRRELIDDLPLFSTHPPKSAATSPETMVEERLREIVPDALSPLEALKLVYELRTLLMQK
jgi:DNA mismatch repair protein MutS